MRYKFILIVFLLIGTHTHTIAQDEIVINPLSKAEIALLDFITKDSSNDINLVLFKPNLRLGFPFKLANGLTLLKKKSKLYIQPMGSGRLYELTKTNTNNYNLLRLDSTYHSGVNFGSINWIYKDTFFQYGGMGFWKIKDHFTFFSSKTHEWELFNSNKRVPIHQNLENGLIYYIDQKAGKFYLSNSIFQQDFPNTLSTLMDDTCRVFNFNDKTWTILGKLNPDLKEIAKKCVDVKSNFGSFVVFHTDLEMYWVNFSKNQYGVLSKNKQAEFREKWLEIYKNNPEHMYQFVYGSVFYLMRIEKNGQLTYKTITLNEIDFVDPKAQPIYTNSVLNSFLKIIEPGKPIMGNTFIVLLVIMLYGLYNKKIRKKKIPTEVKTILYRNFYSALTILEKELILAIYQHQIKNEQISIKTINKIIGVHQKDTITQNKSRSDYFLRINQKFKLATRETELFIIKQREAADKRQYNYNLNPNFIEQLEKLILNNQ